MVLKFLILIAACGFGVIIGFVLGFDAGLMFKEKAGKKDDEQI